MSKIFASLFWLLLSLLALTGCGQKGPLYLPQQIPPQQAAPQQTPAPPAARSTPAAVDSGAKQALRKNKQQDIDSSAKPQGAEAPEPQP